MPDAIVLPILFGMKNWEMHHRLLKWFVKKSDFIIGRNPMGAKLALNYSNNVVFDGRSALKGEIKEYDMASNNSLNQSFLAAEEYVVKNAKHRISVSSELVNFWKRDFGYNQDRHTIIPCSLAYSHESPLEKRAPNEKVRLLFSGGGSPWQSQDEKFEWIRNLMLKNENLEFVFLSKSDQQLLALMEDFPKRVERKWLKPEEVYTELCKADYGILLRENNLTNSVSAPVKFAEYLNAGLNVLISDSVIDYAHFVQKHQCGQVISNLAEEIKLFPISQEIRERNRKLAEGFFSKNSAHIQAKYREVLSKMKA